MRHWDVLSLPVEAHSPEIISSTSDTRAIVLNLPAGERLQEHEVHERAWLVILDGEVEVDTEAGARAEGGHGLVVEFDPRERHQVRARSDVRMLLLLAPWPGRGHPGAMDLREKRHARERARERAEGSA